MCSHVTVIWSKELCRKNYFLLDRDQNKAVNIQIILFVRFSTTSVLSPFSFCCFIPICIYYSSYSYIWLSSSSCAAVVGGFVGVFKDSSHCWPFNDAQADSSPDLVGNFPAQLKVQWWINSLFEGWDLMFSIVPISPYRVNETIVIAKVNQSERFYPKEPMTTKSNNKPA